MHGGVGESGEEEYYKGRVWSAGGWTSVMSTHGMATTTGVATNTERSLSLPYYLPHKAIHDNTDRHGKCAQEHQYGHSARAVQEKRGNGFGSAGILHNSSDSIVRTVNSHIYMPGINVSLLV